MQRTRRDFNVRSLAEPGPWYTDVSRYHSWSIGQLENLRKMHARIEAEDVDLPPRGVERSAVSPSRWSGYLERNMLSDTIVVFAAMSAEAFLNFYGVVRLGETVFSANFERLGVVPKFRELLLVCDSIPVTAENPMVKNLASLAGRRNDLVHSKTKEPMPDGSIPEKWKRPVLDNAVDAVAEMNSFLEGFARLVPAASHLLPYALRTAA